jgi:hypothetical protein
VKHERPWWANVALAAALFGTFVFSPYDLFFVPVDRAEEVWFGITFHGQAAKVGEVAHWIVWATFAYGLWRMRPWVPVLATGYFLQVALAHLVWSVASPRGRGIAIGAIQATIFAIAAALALRARSAFSRTLD